jgi:hypothetical protein
VANVEKDFELPLTLGFKRIKHVHNIDHFPKPIRHASGHGRANSQRSVKPNEIAVHQVQRDRARMIFDLLCESVRAANSAA